ncbi:hypothetical protein BDV93DRAFT_514764 [Ceratobasidium sp. AG-I]|nr:hypothetical protein BDV93DRAFT_514764 [Ceratobasidium sp. AG-I]
MQIVSQWMLVRPCKAILLRCPACLQPGVNYAPKVIEENIRFALANFAIATVPPQLVQYSLNNIAEVGHLDGGGEKGPDSQLDSITPVMHQWNWCKATGMVVSMTATLQSLTEQEEQDQQRDDGSPALSGMSKWVVEGIDLESTTLEEQYQSLGKGSNAMLGT